MSSAKHKRTPNAIIPPTQRETGQVFTQAEDGTRTDLYRVKITRAGPLNLTDANGKLWHARTGESNPPTFPRTFIRRYTRSGPTIAIRHRKSKPVPVYLSDEMRLDVEDTADTCGLSVSAYFRELHLANRQASQKVSQNFHTTTPMSWAAARFQAHSMHHRTPCPSVAFLSSVHLALS